MTGSEIGHAGTATTTGRPPLLEVTDLVKEFPLRGGTFVRRRVGAVHAVSGVSFSIAPGETLGLVGESGCGKSTTGRSVLQLTKPTSGSVKFDGTELTELGTAGPAEDAPGHPGRVPGPLRLARPSAPHRPGHRRTAADPRDRATGRPYSTGSPRC